MIHEYFPLEYQALQAELATGLHPKLATVLATIPADAIDLRLAHIAAYCGIELDGVYSLEARMKIATLCCIALQDLRENPHPTIFIN